MPTSVLATKKQGKKNKDRLKRQEVFRTIEQFSSALTSPNGELDACFPTWSAHLLSRRVKPFEKLLGRAKGCLLWGIQQSEIESSRLKEILVALHAVEAKSNSLNEIAAEWIESAVDRPNSTSFALEAVAWVPALARQPQAFSARLWTDLFSQTVSLANSIHEADVSQNVVAAQLFFGELALQLAYHFPELPQCANLRSQGCRFVSESMLELLDGAGLLAARHLHLMRNLLAIWTRCIALADSIPKSKQGVIAKDARTQYSWMVRQALRLTRRDGSQILSSALNSKAKKIDRELLQVAAKHSRDSQDRGLAQLIVKHDNIHERRLPDDPAYHSEWGHVAILQPEWSPMEPRFCVDYGESSLRSELSNRGQVLFSGNVSPQVLIDSAPVEVVAEWDCSCWFSDQDIDFLELESKLSNGWTIQRQHLLARQDRFLWIADVLIGQDPAAIEYQIDVPWEDGVRYHPAAETTEGMFVGKRPLALMCCPSMPEWASASRHSSMIPGERSLRIKHQLYGRAAYLPIFFDLHRRRMQQPVTWRQLTICENLEIVPRDVAVGFRVHIGLEQWMFYRSLTDGGNRSMIGKNYASEFVCGRFLNDGDVEQLIEVELSDD